MLMCGIQRTGKVTRQDFLKCQEERFRALDLNGDGVITMEEAHRAAEIIRQASPQGPPMGMEGRGLGRQEGGY